MHRVGFNYLDLGRELFTLRTFFLVDPALQSDEHLGRVALLTYAVYRAVHTFRYTRPGTPKEAYDMMGSFLQQAANGDAKASALLDLAKVTEPQRKRARGDAPP